MGLDEVQEDGRVVAHRRLPPMLAAYAAGLLPNQGASGSTIRPTTAGVSTGSGCSGSATASSTGVMSGLIGATLAGGTQTGGGFVSGCQVVPPFHISQ